MTTEVSCANCAAVLARLAAVEARLALLEFNRPDRDGAAAQIRYALASIWAAGIVFSAQDVIDARAHHAELRRALDAALIDNAAQTGCWLRGHTGLRDGIVIERHGRKWACYRLHIDT